MLGVYVDAVAVSLSRVALFAVGRTRIGRLPARFPRPRHNLLKNFPRPSFNIPLAHWRV